MATKITTDIYTRSSCFDNHTILIFYHTITSHHTDTTPSHRLTITPSPLPYHTIPPSLRHCILPYNITSHNTTQHHTTPHNTNNINFYTTSYHISYLRRAVINSVCETDRWFVRWCFDLQSNKQTINQKCQQLGHAISNWQDYKMKSTNTTVF